jgi:hypothetical protein
MLRYGILLLLFPALAAADPHPMNAGGHVGPRVPTKVAIAKETLTIDVKATSGDVRAELELVNNGEATQLLVGFPCEKKPPEGVATLVCNMKLDVSVAGKKQRPKLKWNPDKKTGELTWPMKLAAGERVTLVVAYSSKFVNERYEVAIDGTSHILYRLTTGAEWDGPIGELDIKVTVPSDAIADITPAGYTRQPGVIEWHLTAYEPTEDVILYFPPRVFSMWSGLLAKRKKLADKKLIDGDLSELIDEMMKAADQYLEFAQLLERHFKIPAPPRQRLLDTLARSKELMLQAANK